MFENFRVPAELVPSDPRFGVGPSLVPTQHLQSLAETKDQLLGTSHRKSAFKNVVKEVQEGLKQYFSLPEGYEVVVGNGGATFLFDMIGLGLVKKKSLHYTCGEFSSKWFKAHHKIPWIEAVEKKSEYGKGCRPELDESVDMICTTLNETSTGVITPTVADAAGKDILIAVDGTSGAGQVPLDLEKVDIFFFSAQKIFASEGGLFVAIMSPKAIERAKEVEAQDRYIPDIMSFKSAIDNSLKNQTYTTSSVVSFYLLNEQIKLMNSIGYQKVQAMAQEKANYLYNWATEKDYLRPYIEESEFRSTAVATIDIDDRFPIGDLTKVLREQKVVYDIDAYRKLGRNQLRISLFHNVTLENLKKLTEIIDLAISQNS